MQWSGLPPRQVEAADDARQAGRVQALAEAPLDPAAQRRRGPIDAAVPRPVGAAGDGVQQHSLLGVGQRRRPARPRPVAQASQPFRVEAQHGVARRLPPHPGQSGRFRPAHPPSAPAIAGIRVAVRGFRSRRASRRSRAGLARSVRISRAAPIGPSLAVGEEGITATAKLHARERQSLRTPV
jgi:hypothetical protein